jgi:hypothetical protein
MLAALMAQCVLLAGLQVENPQWVLPSECFNVTQLQQGQDEADVGDWTRACSTAATAATNSSCAAITKQQPLYNCTFKSLSSFYQVQQAIRKHGAVVARCALRHSWCPLSAVSDQSYSIGMRRPLLG